MLPEEFARWAREQREAHGWTYREAQKHTGVSSQTIANVEKGHSIPYMYTLNQMTQAYGYRVDFVLVKDEET